MRVYSIEETDYSCLTDYIKDVVKCGKMLLQKMESGEYGSRMGRKYHDEWEDDDYDWKIKQGTNRYRY